MTEGVLTHSDVVAGLHDIRLPVDAAGGLTADVLAAIGLGLLAAYLLSFLIPLLSTSRHAPVKSLRERVAELADLPENSRTLALLHLLKEIAPERAAKLAEGIYAQGGMPSVDMLEAAIDDAGGVDA